MTKTETHDLIKEFSQPNIEEPIRRLYHDCYESVVIQIIKNGGKPEDGADIFQEAVILLIEKLKSGQFRGESSVKTYLSAIARNLWLHELRTRNRRQVREVRYMGTVDLKEEPDFFTLDEPARKNLAQVLSELGETCKAILTGFYYEGRSMKELMSKFNYGNEQVLRNRKSKCMKKLKTLLTTNNELLRQLKTLTCYEQ